MYWLAYLATSASWLRNTRIVSVYKSMREIGT
jgi:hypothetical protein